MDRIQSLQCVRALVLFGGSHLYGHERANLQVIETVREKGGNALFVINGKWGAENIERELVKRKFRWIRVPYGYHWGSYMFGRYFYYFFINLYGVAATSLSLSKEAKRVRATHLYAGNWLHLTYALPLLIFTRQSLVFRAGDELPGTTFLHRWFSAYLFKRASAIVCNADFLRRRFIGSGAPPGKLRVIYNYPPQRKPAISKPSASLNRSPEEVVILYVGQMSEHKGAGILIDSISRLLKEGANVVLWLVGKATWENEFERELRKRVSHAGLESRSRFLGYQDDVSEAFKRADIHVCPSLWQDPSPNVIFEAKEAGIPTVAFPVGGIPEIIEHQVDGYVCRDCSVPALVEGLRGFLDRDRRLAAGTAAKQSLATRFGYERFGREWSEVFLSTLPKGAADVRR